METTQMITLFSLLKLCKRFQIVRFLVLFCFCLFLVSGGDDESSYDFGL